MIRYQFLRFPEGKTRAVTFSYDDGCRDDLRLVETLDRYGIRATFNINSGFIAEEPGAWRLTESEIRDHLLKQGHEIAVHGQFHRAEGKLRPIEGITDVLECRKDLEQRFDRIIRGMAYPDSGIRQYENGASYERIRSYLKDLDIAYARTLGGDNDEFAIPSDWYQWMPTAHHDNPHLFEYIDKFLTPYTDATYDADKRPRLFYLWGHSFEFSGHDNWDRLEQICERLGQQEDIWYATNMEIYRYVEAYRSLEYSADGSKIYNPSLLTVWFTIDGVDYEVAPGATVTRIFKS